MVASLCELLDGRHECWEFCEQLAQEGRLMAQGPMSAPTASGLLVAEQLDDEEIAIFVPVDDLKSLTGSYRHMRVAAHIICTAQLRQPLPPAWSKVHESD